MAGVAEAAGSAFVASWPNRVDQYQQGVVVAVGRDADHVQEIAGGFTFGPQAFFGARIKRHFAGRLCLGQRLFIHIAQH